jgi:hypothetical protein
MPSLFLGSKGFAIGRFEGVKGGESKLPLCFAAFAIKSRPVRQDI